MSEPDGAPYGASIWFHSPQRKGETMNTHYNDVTTNFRTFRHCADLMDYSTGEIVRTATAAELAESIAAAEIDGGAGVIDVDGRRCWVQE